MNLYLRDALMVFEEHWKCAVDDEEGEPEIECISLVCDPGAMDPPVIRRAAPGTSPPAVLLVPVSELVRVADEALIKASEHWPPSRSIFTDAFRPLGRALPLANRRRATSELAERADWAAAPRPGTSRRSRSPRRSARSATTVLGALRGACALRAERGDTSTRGAPRPRRLGIPGVGKAARARRGER